VGEKEGPGKNQQKAKGGDLGIRPVVLYG